MAPNYQNKNSEGWFKWCVLRLSKVALTKWRPNSPAFMDCSGWQHNIPSWKESLLVDYYEVTCSLTAYQYHHSMWSAILLWEALQNWRYLLFQSVHFIGGELERDLESKIGPGPSDLSCRVLSRWLPLSSHGKPYIKKKSPLMDRIRQDHYETYLLSNLELRKQRWKYRSIGILNWPKSGTGCQRVSLATIKVKEAFQTWLDYKISSLWKLWVMIILKRVGFLWLEPNRLNKLVVDPLEGTCETGRLWKIRYHLWADVYLF